MHEKWKHHIHLQVFGVATPEKTLRKINPAGDGIVSSAVKFLQDQGGFLRKGWRHLVSGIQTPVSVTGIAHISLYQCLRIRQYQDEHTDSTLHLQQTGLQSYNHCSPAYMRARRCILTACDQSCGCDQTTFTCSFVHLAPRTDWQSGSSST